MHEKRSVPSILGSLAWASLGGAFVGGLALTAPYFFEGAHGPENVLVQALFLPLGVAAVSLIVVLPATILFGAPTALLVERRATGRWTALAICLAGAATADFAAHWFVLWNDYTSPADMLYTAPFAIGAALVLWWRLTRAA